MKTKISIILISSLFLSSCSSFYQFIQVSPSSNLKEISFTEDAPNTLFEFYYSDTVANDYLRELRNGYKIDTLVLWQNSDFEKIKTILDWTNKQWNRLDVLIDFSATNGYAKVWLNKQLVSHATVEGGHGKLEQAHFGLYASAALDSGIIYNDKLRIVEVSDEQEVLDLLNDTW